MLLSSPGQVAVAAAHLHQFRQSQMHRLGMVKNVYRALESGQADGAVIQLQRLAKEQMLESADVGDQIRGLHGEARAFDVWRDLVASWQIGPSHREAFGSLDTWQATVDIGVHWFEDLAGRGGCPEALVGPAAHWDGPAVLRWRSRVWVEGWTAHLTRQLAEQIAVYCLAAYHGHRMCFEAALEDENLGLRGFLPATSRPRC